MIKVTAGMNGKAGVFAVCLALLLPGTATAHCDALDGPVVQDARKAIAAQDVTPVLKWIKSQDEKTVKTAFKKVLTARTQDREGAERQFFSALVKVHRASEGAPFTGLKPAGSVDPAVAEADKALASGSSDALVKQMTDDIAAGIRLRYKHVADAMRHKDESVEQGRKFVEAYVAFTHYVERLHQSASSAAHEEHRDEVKKHSQGKGKHKH